MITTRQALDILGSGRIVALTFITYDKSKDDRSGRIIHLEEAQLVRKHLKPKTVLEPVAAQLAVEVPNEPISETRRNPQHQRNYTRNVRKMQNGFPTAIIRKLHPPLIIAVDGEIVVP